ncbi:MAG: nuclear transport factor 2 family protein [Gammaproteobacteria bacterium]
MAKLISKQHIQGEFESINWLRNNRPAFSKYSGLSSLADSLRTVLEDVGRSVRQTALMSVLMILLGLSSHAFAQSEEQSVESSAIAAVLDAYHEAAANGDWSTYFDLLSEDAVFLGTDAAERWPKDVFRRYAENSSGWVYHPQERHINLTPDGQSAWFDELLASESYGTSRGTGVLIKTASGWRISQYHLTFPIPNELVNGITAEIKEFETQASQ